MHHHLCRIALVAGLALGSAAQAASDFTVLNGSWGVTSELNGQPGRGMTLDVQDGILAMPVYNYDAQGEPTFHLTSGPIVNNRFQGDLKRYRGGRSFGGPARDAVEEGSAGAVEVLFSDANNGTIRFPGEAPLSISRYRFDGIDRSHLALPGTTQWWAVAQLDENRQPVGLWWLQFGTERQANGSFATKIKYARTQGLQFASDTTCSSADAEGAITCKLPLANTGETVTMRLRTTIDSLSGSFVNDQIPGIVMQLVGGRIYTQTASGAVLDTPPTPVNLSAAQLVQPEPGTWTVPSENTGQPGRGFAIDVQDSTLVVQVYNYETSGAGTFHLAAGPYADGRATARLKRYSGGPSFGGPTRWGREAGDAGEVQLSFTSSTRGFIQFPGESPVAIERFEYGSVANIAMQRMLGRWAFLDFERLTFHTARLTTLTNGRAEGSGLQCSAEVTDQGNVRCVEVFRISGRPDAYLRDYRFRMGTNARALGVSMVINNQGQVTSASTPLLALRTEDANGVLAGNGAIVVTPNPPGSVQTIQYEAIDDANVSRPSRAIVHFPPAAERRPVVLIAPGWDGLLSLAPTPSDLAARLSAMGYVAVDMGFNSMGAAWNSDIAYNAAGALTKLCADFAQRVNCNAIIWVGTSYSGTQSLVVTKYLRGLGRSVVGFVSQEAGYTLHWTAPNHANLSEYSIALIQNLGDEEFPTDSCAGGNCGARERARWHRNNGVNTDKVLSWCPAGGSHGSRNNVPGGAAAWDNWVISSIKTMLHTHRGVPTFTGYGAPTVAVSNACAS